MEQPVTVSRFRRQCRRDSVPLAPLPRISQSIVTTACASTISLPPRGTKRVTTNGFDRRTIERIVAARLIDVRLPDRRVDADRDHDVDRALYARVERIDA